MTYSIQPNDPSKSIVTVADLGITPVSAINLVGKDDLLWGTVVNQNFYSLVENFASPNSPANPIEGQIWYDSTATKLKVYGLGQWLDTTSTVATTAPGSPTIGEQWVNPNNGELAYYDGTEWVVILTAESIQTTTIDGNTNKILLKRTTIAGQVPIAHSLNVGEVELNTTDGRLFMGKTDGSIQDLKANDTITISGDISGAGQTSITTVLAASGVTPGTYTKTTFDSKGRATAGQNPTNLAGYGITDAQPLSTILTAIAGSGGQGFVSRTNTNTAVVNTVTGNSGRINVTGGDGSVGTVNIDLATTGVAANTYTKVTVDTYGRVTSATNLSSGDITGTLGYTPVNKAGDTMSGFLTLSADPTSPLHAVTKQYTDNLVSGLSPKGSCACATTVNITLSGLQTIDGYTTLANDRVLVKNQTDQTTNGIWIASSTAWTRATDSDNVGNTTEVKQGIYTLIDNGTTNNKSGWYLTTANPVTVGTSALTWVQFNGLAQISVGGGMTIAGNQLSVATASSSRIVVNASNIDLAVTGVSAGTYSQVVVDSYGRVTSASNPVTGVTAGTYQKVTVNTSGLVTAGTSLSASDIPNLDWSKITTGTPTTLSGYGITNAQPLNAVLTSASAISTIGLVALTAANTIGTVILQAGAHMHITSPDGSSGGPIIGLSNSGVTPGTYTKVTVDASGIITTGSSPTTIAAYGITDAVAVNPVTPKNGDIQVSGSVISIYGNSAWNQIYPAVYS